MGKVAIWWTRRDLRLTDNDALNTALRSAEKIIPLFVLDPSLIDNPNASAKRLEFLYSALNSLNQSLTDRGGKLIIRNGKPLEVLTDLVRECGVTSIFAEEDFSPYALRRDGEISKQLPLKLIGSTAFRHPKDLVKSNGTPYTVYTPYMRAWKSQSLPRLDLLKPAPEQVRVPDLVKSDPIPSPSNRYLLQNFPATELEAQNRLSRFTEGHHANIFRYGADRNQMDLDGTSRLSPYLRFGMISARQAIVMALSAQARARSDNDRKGAETWLNELIWREFYISILYHFPNVLRESFRPELRKIRWRNDPQEYSAWCDGRTGYPIVDAAMRQLVHTGWMHNRARMIVASFLVKDLLVDWRWGEKFFMQHLLDGDPAVNNGGWQWTAGTGTDAAPYFRIFNPTLQSQKFDPQGDYIRRWVPELTHVPAAYIHQPSLMSEGEQLRFQCRVGIDYPAPIVDHHQVRELTLAAYGQS
jgi:deoxyribodipyrimidine photo-lyase